MFWNSISNNKYRNTNLIVSGICACPGIVTGRICVWSKECGDCFKEGDILLILDLIGELPPLWVIQRASAIISCRHTSYSHLTSLAMALNKPCIVGAVFNCMPENHGFVVVDAWENIVAYSEENNSDLLMSNNQNKWLVDIANKVCEKLYSGYNKPLAHVVALEGEEYYIDNISGIFLDSMIFQKAPHVISELKNTLHKIYNHHPGTEIYYRFSPSAIGYENNKLQLQREIDFVCSLQNEGIPICVFIANATSYEDIIAFRQFISLICPNAPIKIGTMVENKQIVNCLNYIVGDDLIDFAAIGINDLMSSYLQLDRDDPKNQDKFRIDEKTISNALISIRDTLASKSIPCYIGFPKYARFFYDYELLNNFGYSDFFGTHSLFMIAQKYRR